MERIAYPINEAAFALGISRTSLYRLHAAGEISFAKIGSRSFVTADEIDRFMSGCAGGA